MLSSLCLYLRSEWVHVYRRVRQPGADLESSLPLLNVFIFFHYLVIYKSFIRHTTLPTWPPLEHIVQTLLILRIPSPCLNSRSEEICFYLHQTHDLYNGHAFRVCRESECYINGYATLVGPEFLKKTYVVHMCGTYALKWGDVLSSVMPNAWSTVVVLVRGQL